MTRPGLITFLLGNSVLVAVVSTVSAEDAAQTLPESVIAPALVVTPEVSRAEKDSGPLIKAPKSRKGRRREQKETEGTEALERFQANTILKSPYTLDGQPLEVDPD